MNIHQDNACHMTKIAVMSMFGINTLKNHISMIICLVKSAQMLLRFF